MTHKKPITKLIAGVLSVVMVFGVLMFVSPTEAQAISLNATDTGFYNVSYEEKETIFGVGSQIRVENKMRTSKNSATYTLTEEGWKTTDAFVWNGASKNEFEAWYPFNASYTEFTIPTDQSSDQLLGAADWMTASSGEIDKPENHTLNLYFGHHLAKVTVNIVEWNSEFDGSEKIIEDLKIYSKGAALTATYGDSGATITATDGETGITPLASGTSYTAIVAPAKYANTDKFLTFTACGQEMTVLATPSRLNEEGLQAGLHYLFDLKVGKDCVAIQSVEVTDWTDRIINDVESEEQFVFVTKKGTTATVTTREGATASDMRDAIAQALASGVTTLMVEGTPSAELQAGIAAALDGKTDVDLVLGGVSAPIEAITSLSGIDIAYKNGTGSNGYVVAEDGTYIVTSKDGLYRWNSAADTYPYDTNLTLACDVDYNGEYWSAIPNTNTSSNKLKYNGVVDGNGYAIKNLNCKDSMANSSDYTAAFIYRLGENGVIKNLSLIGGEFTYTKESLGDGAGGFAFENYGVIMGCYNANSCSSTGGYGRVGGIATYNHGVIVGCSNSGAIGNAGDHESNSAGGVCAAVSAGNRLIASYNTGAFTVPSDGLKGSVVCHSKGSVIDCYYSSSPKGVASGSGETTRWTSDDWSEPMARMNEAIEEYNKTATVKCNYRYAINTDAATKSARPLVIVEVGS